MKKTTTFLLLLIFLFSAILPSCAPKNITGLQQVKKDQKYYEFKGYKKRK